MAKQLNVNLAFTADTGAAKQQIKSLEQDLKNLISATGSTKDFKLTKELVEAKEAAGQLKLALQNATTSTGSLDLSKFDQAIKNSGMSLEQYRKHLSNLGPAGQQAFAKMAQSIIQAEVPLRRTNALLDQFKTTLINTARWQISSSMLHGFMGALQSAYGYAQDLNGSLNNIRIVTGQSVDEMAAFADRANKAAQALSTSTTSYTDAALIYYQQGIRDQEEIAERTETTIKLANVSRQSAEEVSQQMTAIWNNFDDGSKALEYYADAITALGATTASSSAEIATGLEKFAAIADTVGLSFEYATAAMATITAQTRQSADTVGTGLRTIFSRLESLKLGDTLEDGVDLNKYSQALDDVGVKVLDATGNLREMDDILDDLGGRWENLSKAQQIALAQTVGGVRQYTNLIALMDNWDKMQENVATAKGSEGTLQEQADIYAESWEAAQKRVKAAAQALYSDLLDDKFFISLNNLFADLLQGVDAFIDGIGGLRTILPAIGLLLTNAFGKQMAENIDNIIFNMQRGTEAVQKRIEQQKAEAYKEASAMFKGASTSEGQAQEQALKGQLDLTFQLKNAAKNLTDEEIQRYQASIDIVSAIQDQAVALGQAADAANKAKEAQMDALTTKAIDSQSGVADKVKAAQGAQYALENVEKQVQMANVAKQAVANLNRMYKEGTISVDQYANTLGKINNALQGVGFKKGGAMVSGLQKAMDKSMQSTQAFEKEIEKLLEKKGLENNAYIDTSSTLEMIADKYGWTRQECAEYLELIQKNIDAGMSFADAERTAARAVDELKEKIAAAENAMKTLGTTGQTIMSVFQGITQTWMGISSIVNAFQTLSNPDASGWEKFNAVILGLGMGLPMVYRGLQSLVTVNESLKAVLAAETALESENLIVKYAAIAADAIQNGLKALQASLTSSVVGAKLAELGATEALTTAQLALNAAMDANPIGVLILAIAALIAIIAGAIKGISALANAFGDQTSAAEKASEASSNLAEKFGETQQRYENLKSTISDYESSLSAINTLSTGTQEWKDQIRQTNVEALKLINTLGLLQGYDYTVDKDGIIHINKESLKNAENEYSKKADQAEAASIMGEAKASEKQKASDLKDLQNERHMSLINGMLAGGAVGATTGNPIGVAIGAAVGGIATSVGSMISDAAIENAVNRLTSGDLAKDFSEGKLSASQLKQELNIDDDDLINAIMNLASSMNQNTDAQHAAAEIAAKTVLKNNDDVQNSAYAEKISRAAGNIYEQSFDKSYDKYSDQMSGLFNKSDKLFDQYAKETGIDQLKGYKDEGTDDDGNHQYSYLDESGKRTEVITVLDDEIATTLASIDAEKTLTETASGLISEFEHLDKAGDGASQALKDFLTTGDLSAAKSKDLTDLKNKMGDQSAKDYLGSVLGDGENGLSNEEARALGFSSASELINAFTEGLENADADFAKAGQNIATQFKDAFEDIVNTGNISAEGKNKLASQINQALEQGGQEGAQGLIDMYKALSPDQLESVVQAFDEIDWDSISPNEFRDKMAELGVTFDESQGSVASFIDLMREAEGLNFDNALNSFKTLSGVMDKVNEYGDTISADEFKELPAAAKDFFRENLEGEYELVGDAEQFKEIVEGIDLSKFEELYNQEAAKANALVGANTYNTDSGNLLVNEGVTAQGTDGNVSFDEGILNAQIELVKAYQDELGLTDEQLSDLVNHDFSAMNVEDAQQKFSELTDKVQELGLTTDNIDDKFLKIAQDNQELANQMAMSAQSEEQLNGYLEDGIIDLNTYNEAYKTLSEIEGVDDDHVQDMKDLGDYYAENADQIDGLSKSLKGNKKACQDIAKVITRYNEAMESANENMDNWKDNLKPVNKGTKDYMKTVDGLRKAYGDLANKDGKKLSQNFVENKEHMEDLEKAMNGDTEAADRLEDAINKEYLTQIGIDTDNFEADRDKVQSMAEELAGQDFDDIEVGAELNDEGFLNALTEMVNAAGMTADQATAYLASMGIDAEVVEDDTTTEEKTEAVGVDTTLTPHQATVTMPTVSGGSSESGNVPQITGSSTATVSYPSVDVTPQKEEETAQKEQKSFSLKVTNAKRGISSGGNFKHSAGGGGGGGGGGCFLAGTLISTIQGFRPIEEVQVGDIVLSYNTETQENEYSEVLETMIHVVNGSIYTLYIREDQLKVTGVHRFYINRNGKISWIHASDLRVGDLVLFADNTWHPILKIDREEKLLQIVYNFEVSDNHNYYVGENQILAHNKGGRGRRGGGGRKQIEQKKGRNDAERYHVVTNQLDVLSKGYDKISKAYDRAFGKSKLKLLDQQIKQKEKMIAKQKEYVKEIEKNLKLDRQNLQSKGKTKFWSENAGKNGKLVTADVSAKGYLGMDVKFDAGGSITNYDALMEKAYEKYNKAVDKFNKSKQKKADKKAFELAQAQYDGFMEMMKQYEETNALYLDETNNLIEQQNELYDMKLEKVTISVKLKVDVADDKLKYLDNLFEQLGDSAYNAAKRIALVGQQLQADKFKIDAYKQGIQDIFKNHGLSDKESATVLQDFQSGKLGLQELYSKMSADGSGNKFTESEIEYFREAAEAAAEYNSQAIAARKQVAEEIGTVMDDNAEKLDRIADKMEYLKSLANSYKNIVDLTGRQYLKISTEMYDAMEATNVNLAKQSVTMAKDRKKQAESEYKMLLQEYSKVQGQLSDQEKDIWKERINAAAENVQTMTQNFYSSWEEAIEAVNTRFESRMNNISEDFSKRMAKNAGSLDALSERLSLKKEMSETFLPEYEKIYQLTKLSRDAQKAIDQSNNVKVQRELQAVQQKILEAQKSGKELSEYDIKYLEKELELKKAQMALEEASQVKSQVRMSRDSEGNYSYVYTADETAVEDAESEYAAKLYEMQKLNEEYIQNLNDQMFDLQNQYIAAMQGAAELYGHDTEAYNTAVKNINDDYQQYFNNLNDQMAGALENQATTQEEHAAIYVALTGDVAQANVDLTTSWEETTLAALTGFESLEEYQNTWLESSNQVLADSIDANKDWADSIDEIYTAAGVSVETFVGTAGAAMVELNTQGEATAQEMSDMCDVTTQALSDVVDAVVAWEQQYSASIEANIQANNEFIESVNDLIAALSGVSEITNQIDLDSIRASLDQATADYTKAKENTRRARRKVRDTRRRVGRRLRRAERRVTNARRRVTNARRRVNRARRAVSDAKRALRRARGRRAKARAKRDLRRAQNRLRRANRTLRRARSTLREAKRRLRTAVRRASRAQRRKWNTYQRARKDYTAARRTEADKKANVQYWQDKYDAAVKAQSEQQAEEAETPVTINNAPAVDTSAVDSAVDSNTQAFIDALNKTTISPIVNVDFPKDLKQTVTFEKIELPNVTSEADIINAIMSLINKDAASQYIG